MACLLLWLADLAVSCNIIYGGLQTCTPILPLQDLPDLVADALQDGCKMPHQMDSNGYADSGSYVCTRHMILPKAGLQLSSRLL